MRPPARRARRTTALLLAASLATSGCSGPADDGDRLTVLAAASLTEVFEELADEFEAARPEVEVRLSFGSSTTLAEQAVQGAPGDVLATADTVAMAVAEDGGALAGAPQTFATNRLALVVPPGNPAGIRGPADLDGTTWVRCADEAPCGRAAVELLGDDPTGRPASLEVDVKAVLAKVAAGEADAGIVYHTDAVAAGDDVEVVELPGSDRHPVASQVAVLDAAARPDLAEDWIELLGSATGRSVLGDAGFGPP